MTDDMEALKDLLMEWTEWQQSQNVPANELYKVFEFVQWLEDMANG